VWKRLYNTCVLFPWPATPFLSWIKRNHTFIGCLQAAKVTLTEYEFNQKNVPNLQSHLVSTPFMTTELFQSLFCHNVITWVAKQENIVGENYFLNQSAKEAYRSYVLAYDSHSMKDIFNVHQLDLQVNVLQSFQPFDRWYYLKLTLFLTTKLAENIDITCPVGVT